MGQDRSKKRAQIIDQFTRSEPQLSRFSKGSESFIRSDRPLRFTFFVLIHFFRNKSAMSELVDYLRPFLNRVLGPCRGVLSICIFVHKLHDCVTSICCRKTFCCSFVWSHVIWGTYSLRNLATDWIEKMVQGTVQGICLSSIVVVCIFELSEGTSPDEKRWVFEIIFERTILGISN